jgi:hypothetical protein
MANSELSGEEVVTLVQTIFNALKLLVNKNALAGMILAYDAYDEVRDTFGHEAKPYEVDGVILDPMRHNSFVVDGMLFLRGTGE